MLVGVEKCKMKKDALVKHTKAWSKQKIYSLYRRDRTFLEITSVRMEDFWQIDVFNH